MEKLTKQQQIIYRFFELDNKYTSVLKIIQ